jgi:hypothetical protein
MSRKQKKTIKPTTKKLFELLAKREKLLEEAELSQASIDFWSKQVMDIDREIEDPKMKEWEPGYEEYIKGLKKKLEYLATRGPLESAVVDKLEDKAKELEKSVKELYNEKKKN